MGETDDGFPSLLERHVLRVERNGSVFMNLVYVCQGRASRLLP